MTDINKINPGIDTSFSTKLNANLATSLRQSGLTQVQQLQDRAVTSSADGGQFAEAYIDADGRNDSVVGAETIASFDTNKYTATSGTEPFFLIEASSISSIGDFAINNCYIIPTDTGKWLLRCSSGTDEVKRAQIYRTLFAGEKSNLTLHSNPRATSTYITGWTAFKTNITRDVGKQAHYASIETDTAFGNYDGSFANTSTNTDCSSWSTVDYPLSGAVSTELGTDLTGDENDNPSDCKLINNGVTNIDATWQIPTGTTRNTFGNTLDNEEVLAEALVLCVGDLTWTEDTTSGTPTYASTDFVTDHSVPVLTELTASDFDYTITHTIPSGTFSSTLSSAFMTFKAEDWESGADVQYKFTNYTYDDLSASLSDPDSYTDPTNAFDKDFDTFATKNLTVLGTSASLGETWSATTVEYARVKLTTAGSANHTTKLQSYNGSTWDDVETLTTGDTEGYNGYVAISSSIQGLRILFETSQNGTCDVNIFLIEAMTRVDGAYLDSNEVVSFTARTVEPEEVIVKLIPKSSSPTAGYPSINGVALYGDRPA